jgi:hypothetical protein
MKNTTNGILILLFFCQISPNFVLLADENPTLNDTGPYGGGQGTADDPYRIYTPEQMNEIGTRANDWGKQFILMTNIDLSEYQGQAFHIIGSYTDTVNNRPFSGVFDGNHYSIYNFNYTSTAQDYIGIFGYASGAQIKNLRIVDPNIHTGGSSVGSLVGWLRNGNLSNCSVKNCRLSGASNIGGLVGHTMQGSIRIFQCSSSGAVSGDAYVGGLVGQIGDGAVSMCFSNVSVVGNRNVGGLVGKTGEETSVVSDCYATGSVEGDQYVGGLVGQVERGAAYQCYCVGKVTGQSNTGGLTGYIRVLGIVLRCFWDTQTSGQATSPGGDGKTTDEMKSIDTFISSAWDFWNVWTMCEGMNYPVLQWQIPTGDFLCPDGVNFIDFSFFAEHWLENNCTAINGYCSGTDLDQSGFVGYSDLAIFSENWLEGIFFIDPSGSIDGL